MKETKKLKTLKKLKRLKVVSNFIVKYKPNELFKNHDIRAFSYCVLPRFMVIQNLLWTKKLERQLLFPVVHLDS